MREIRGSAKTVRELLSGAKYGIDYYQREYKWQTKQVHELVDDLAGKFLEDYEPTHEPGEVAGYGHYFLGSIIVSQKGNQQFIIDGQQRLTTLTLFLIYLNNLQRNRGGRQVQIQDLIFSERYGKRSFNLDVEERTTAMDALFTGQPFDETGRPESVRNIVARYRDVEDYFPDELRGDALPYFMDWAVDNVHLVAITAYSDDDAYTIFETMNDRGLSLTPADMLKGFLLNNITDEQQKLEASRVWKERITALTALGKDEDADAIKAWLRSQYVRTIRERKKGAVAQDFDLVGTEFHRWVRDHKDDLGLATSTDFHRFVIADFAFFSRQYERIRWAATTYTPGAEAIFYNAQAEFTLQYPLLLAPLRVDDSEAIVDEKLRVVAAFVDIQVARRNWNWRSTAYSTMQYATFLVIKDIRGKALPELRQILRARLDAETETFASNDRYSLHQMNRRTVHQILARLTDHVEQASGLAGHYLEYITTGGRNRYEVEHIWADHPERHADEFSHPADFWEHRNRIGGLLLLPKQFNASYSDLPYEDKLPKYYGQNLLAQSLNAGCYQNHPGFTRYALARSLPFRSHAQFRKADLEARQELYRRLAEEVWNPERVGPDLGGTATLATSEPLTAAVCSAEASGGAPASAAQAATPAARARAHAAAPPR